jgi:endonuclease YncB( thermonuclease family)
MIKILVVFLLLLFTIKICVSETIYPDMEVKNIISVYDGDTFCANLNNKESIIGEKILIRIDGIDTPEIRNSKDDIKELAVLARDYLFLKLTNAKIIKLKKVKRDKYFRIRATVIVDGNDISIELLALGLAKSYHGESKTSLWKEQN